MEKKRVLVVEDHFPLQQAIKTILRLEGYEVETAANGVEGLAKMEAERPDLIVADIMMPEMDGYEFYETVRRRSEWVSIPFIFLTARAEREDVLRGKAMGAEDYITKPFDPQELVVTVRARLERVEAVQKATAAEFERLKQEIVTVLSHELRTPLTYVTGYTDLALEDAANLSPDGMIEFLQGIKRGADRLNRLVEDLLLLVRLDTGRAAEEFRQLVRTNSSLGLLVERVVRRYAEQAQKHGVTLDVALLPDLPPVRLCEPFLEDALGRLVENGIKFSHDGEGRVTVHAQVVGDCVEIAIVDKGVGIPPAELPRVFDRFYQVDRQRMEQQGMGLGLAIARELVRLHGGDITAQSEVGRGSAFVIRLPIARSE